LNFSEIEVIDKVSVKIRQDILVQVGFAAGVEVVAMFMNSAIFVQEPRGNT